MKVTFCINLPTYAFSDGESTELAVEIGRFKRLVRKSFRQKDKYGVDSSKHDFANHCKTSNAVVLRSNVVSLPESNHSETTFDRNAATLDILQWLAKSWLRDSTPC